MADAGTLVFRDRAGNAVATLDLLVAASGDASAAAGQPPALLEVPTAQAQAEGEAALQILEGLRYEYQCSHPGLRLGLHANDTAGVVCPSRLPGRQHSGALAPGLATGLLQLALLTDAGQPLAWAAVEVRSRKLDYKADYRRMMEDISARCVDLLGDWQAASQLKLVPDAGHDAATIGQRFAFVRALLDGQGFRHALQRILSQPHQRWEAAPQDHALGRGVRPGRQLLVQLAQGGGRVPVPAQHPLHQRLTSLPGSITLRRPAPTQDTPENRFVKFVLRGFQAFLDQVSARVPAIQQPRLAAEVLALSQQLAAALDSSLLRHTSDPTALPLGSPVLQRREGYREVLQAWLKFSLAARLVWHGGDDVYGAGQRDVATLYEYWVFFCLLDLVSDLFALDQPPGQSLLEPTADGFGLKLKAGRFMALHGEAVLHERHLKVQFSYNRSFGANAQRDKAGSWTEPMRPDYTLSLWPAAFSASEAEAQELMVHVHFDAKYRVDNLRAMLGDAGEPAATDDPAAALDAALAADKQAQRQGQYKRADLLKMHAYRDAIRRSHGAYVLYPGDTGKALRGFHEVLPGLGAFALRPGGGTGALAAFLGDVVAHVCNRASAREAQSFSVLQTYRASEPAPLYQAFAERQPVSGQRHQPPQQTWVLVGWCKDDDHLRWIHTRGLYNFRMNDNRGSLALSPEVAGASYLLLHGPDGTVQPGLLRIKRPSAGPRVFAQQALAAAGYPGQPSQSHYLVFDVEAAADFAGLQWAWTKLAAVRAGASTGLPFAISLQQLLLAAVTQLRDNQP